jgi:hypothetical protein
MGDWQLLKQINGETGRNGFWFPEDGDSCYKTGWMDAGQFCFWFGTGVSGALF